MVRAYAGTSGNKFIVAPIGIKTTTRFTAKAGMDVDVLDPVTGKVLAQHSLNAGGRFDLSGHAYVLRGTWK